MFEKLLLAVDGSDHARRAIPFAADLAKKSGGQVTVLHVREHGTSKFTEWERETAEDAQAVVDGVVRELDSDGVRVASEMRRALGGRAAREICDVADELDADLIVMGPRGLNDLEGLVVGSVAHKVLHLTKRPVLIAH